MLRHWHTSKAPLLASFVCFTISLRHVYIYISVYLTPASSAFAVCPPFLPAGVLWPWPWLQRMSQQDGTWFMPCKACGGMRMLERRYWLRCGSWAAQHLPSLAVALIQPYWLTWRKTPTYLLTHSGFACNSWVVGTSLQQGDTKRGNFRETGWSVYGLSHAHKYCLEVNWPW